MVCISMLRNDVNTGSTTASKGPVSWNYSDHDYYCVHASSHYAEAATDAHSLEEDKYS